jgi:hypothetical protein
MFKKSVKKTIIIYIKFILTNKIIKILNLIKNIINGGNPVSDNNNMRKKNLYLENLLI